MARTFNGSVDLYVNSTTAPSTLTIAIWASHNSTANIGTAMQVGRSDLTDTSEGLFFRGDTVGDPLQFRFADNVSAAGANHGSAYVANTLYHCAGVVAANNSHSVLRDGAGKVTNTTSIAPATKNIIAIGSNWFSAAAHDRINGKTAIAAFWTTALTDGEIASLSKGFSARRIRPQNLIFYAPLVRNVFDWIRGLGFTDTGTTVSDHPRSYGM